MADHNARITQLETRVARLIALVQTLQAQIAAQQADAPANLAARIDALITSMNVVAP